MAAEAPQAITSIRQINPDIDPARIRSGKVRERISLGDERLLMMATDNISIFDVVLPTPIPGKGIVLTEMSGSWMNVLKIPNDAITYDIDEFPEEFRDPRFAGRTTIVHEGEIARVECIARGYIAGSMWGEYKETGGFVGQRLEEGLSESQQLSSAIFTPSTKEDEGHDRNISFEEMIDRLGVQFPQFDARRLAGNIRERTLGYYEAAADYAFPRGIIIADTNLNLLLCRMAHQFLQMKN